MPSRGCTSPTPARTASMSSTATQRTFLRSHRRPARRRWRSLDQEHDLLFTSDRGCCSGQRLPLLRRGAPRTRRALGRIRTGSHTTRSAAASTASTSANLSASAAPRRSSTSIRWPSWRRSPLPGRPRWAVYDAASDVIYANIRDPAVVAADRLRAQVAISSSIDVPVAGPHGLWVDGGRLYCAADGGALVVLDRDTGDDLGLVAAPRRPGRRLARRAGLRAVRRRRRSRQRDRRDTARLALVETVATESGAHTLGWDPRHETLYVFYPESCGAALFTQQDDGS